MISILKKIKNFVLSHKWIMGIAVLLIIVAVIFIVKNSNKGEANYSTEKVKISDITSVVTGTGQVEATSTITLGPKASGIVTYVGVKTGDHVKKGQLLASVDSRDAKIALENAKISLRKLTEVDSLDLLKSENSLKVSYDSGWNKVSSYITDTTKLLDEIKDIFGNDGYLGYKNISGVSNIGREKISSAESSYYDARESLDELTKLYKTLSRSDSNEKIKDLVDNARRSSVLIATLSKKTEEALNYTVKSLDDEDSTNFISARENVTSWLSTSNSYTNSLLSAYNSIVENDESYKDAVSPGDQLDVLSAQLNVESKLNSYNDCFVYAPFDGIIATFTAKVGENVNSGVGTIITKQKVVTVSLNEVDIASVSIGKKAVITFDAIGDLSISGTVSEIDSVGTVSSGVVNYNVKIVLDNDDERVKAGMSANVEVVLDSKKGVLTLSSGAIKTRGGSSYVEVMGDSGQIVRKNVETGISDDTRTEIISGLSDGDEVIVRTSLSSNKNNAKMMGGSAMGGMIH